MYLIIRILFPSTLTSFVWHFSVKEMYFLSVEDLTSDLLSAHFQSSIAVLFLGECYKMYIAGIGT